VRVDDAERIGNGNGDAASLQRRVSPPSCREGRRYHVALEFLRLAAHVAGRASAPLRDQLDRASASIVLNIAEGGRFVAKLSA